MIIFIRLYKAYVKRILKDSFTIGYSIIFPFIMIGLLGWIRKGHFSNGLTSYQYYSITMISFCICCELITAVYQGQEEGRLKVAERFLIAPISTRCLMVSKWCAGVTALSICHGIVYVMLKLLFRVSYHGAGIAVYLLSIGLTALIYALGLLMGLGMRNFIKFKSIVNIPIFVIAILGGCFFPFGSFSPLVAFLIKLSPLTWIHRSVFLSMFDYSYRLLLITISITILFGYLLLRCGIKKFKKEGFLYGESLSFRK